MWTKRVVAVGKIGGTTNSKDRRVDETVGGGGKYATFSWFGLASWIATFDGFNTITHIFPTQLLPIQSWYTSNSLSKDES